MPQYAVKIGEVHLVAGVPITKEDCVKAAAELERDPGGYIKAGYAIVRLNTELTVHRH